MSTSAHASNGMALTDVPPPMRPTLKVVFGSRGTSKSAILRHRAAERLNRIDHAEGAVAVAAGALERDAVAQAADGDVRDAEPGAVDRHEPIDLALHAFAKQILHAAQIAEPFLAHRADKGDRAGRLRGCALTIVRATASRTARPRQSSPMPGPRSIAPSRFTVDRRAFGKHGVEVRAEHQVRPRLRCRAVRRGRCPPCRCARW